MEVVCLDFSCAVLMSESWFTWVLVSSLTSFPGMRMGMGISIARRGASWIGGSSDALHSPQFPTSLSWRVLVDYHMSLFTVGLPLL